MRAIELLENKITMKNAWNLIQRDCQQYLRTKGQDDNLYRGINELSSGTEEFVKLPVRHDRRPLDTSPEEHKIIIQAMKEAQFDAHRGNSIFCRSIPENLDTYGEVYVIFPIGNFSITWSPDIDDWAQKGNYVVNNFEYEDDDDKLDIDMYGLVEWFKNNYIENEWEDAMDHPDSEIMVATKEYYAIILRGYNTDWDFLKMNKLEKL